MRWKRSLLALGAVLVPLVMGASSPQWVEQIRVATGSLAYPLLEFQHRVSRFVRTQVETVGEWAVLRQRNRALDEELKRLRADRVAFSELAKENERLKTLLNLKESSTLRTRPARVIGRDPSHWSLSVVINQGSRDGVKEDDALIHSDGLVGKVVSVGSRSSRAILLTDRQSRVSALNQRTRDVGLIEGTGSFLLKMVYLDRNADIQVGDVILSSGLGGIYPKGIPIGRVQLIGEEAGSLGLYAVVKPFVRFGRLEEVLCVSSPTSD